MTDRIHITEAESVVMAALWRHGALSAASLIEAVKARQAWGDATIKTLLSRLIHKKAILSEKVDGRQLYRALLDRDAYVAGEVADLVDRLFDGDPHALAAHLAKD
ncbi:BlaI/MecI/CopY family transcriptional regulator [Caulobacter mirabilis]|uniref:BlaI/MecI/CopY family transcriptional regulator n=1 Tax=Caulobacter mirabilis TaxID=69666 RepID=A0A2D2ATT8_9CAUL|nr:BlaI/MecI/CopY family transcriptional regulator [Caulobacter mirabilis]ATQ41420.1 BlaI/MecI/CopY family transcriptional regulator [Caulobacter mirabilis]